MPPVRLNVLTLPAKWKVESGTRQVASGNCQVIIIVNKTVAHVSPRIKCMLSLSCPCLVGDDDVMRHSSWKLLMLPPSLCPFSLPCSSTKYACSTCDILTCWAAAAATADNDADYNVDNAAANKLSHNEQQRTGTTVRMIDEYRLPLSLSLWGCSLLWLRPVNCPCWCVNNFTII